jgi:hypothetical protein
MTRRFTWAVVAGISLLLIGACQKQPPEPEYEVTATVKDVMDAMVDPIADVLWESVATIVTSAGTEERAPKSDEDWARVRRGAITLVEATNLLRMPGRRIARPGEKSENPNIELEPEETGKPGTSMLTDSTQPPRWPCGRSTPGMSLGCWMLEKKSMTRARAATSSTGIRISTFLQCRRTFPRRPHTEDRSE